MPRCGVTWPSSSTWRATASIRRSRTAPGYPGPGARRRARIGWLRRHLVPASAYYVNTVGRGLDQIRQEAKLRDALEDHLDQRDWAGRSAAEVRQDLQDYVASRGDLSWAWQPPAPPPLLFRIREAVHKVAMPLLLLLLLPVLLAVLPFWILALRKSELAHQPEITRPTQQQMDELEAWEDFETQNPYAVIGFIKPGRLHLLTMRAVQLATSYGARHLFTHGSLAGVKTIHFARWVPLDGWRRMTFVSNYDGAVEAYNDDFINEIWWGLNAVFGSAVGYPPTRWLLWGGAKLEQPFKYTLRDHQVPVPAWYTAYPTLSADNIENNARIRAGLAGEMSPAEAGAVALPPVRRAMTDTLDRADIQGIVARGYSGLGHARFTLFACDDQPAARALLGWLLPRVTTAARKFSADTAVHVAFTPAGPAPARAAGGGGAGVLAGVPGRDGRTATGAGSWATSASPTRAAGSGAGLDGPAIDGLILLYATQRGTARRAAGGT